MIKLTVSDQDPAENLFGSSIYTNTHLGWFDLWKLPDNNGQIWLDKYNYTHFLIAVQHLDTNLFLLHSFYSSAMPGSYPLKKRLQSILPSGNNSIYTIASHNWYSDFLETNGFHLQDEILQMETNEIRLNDPHSELCIKPFSHPQINDVYQNCETAFSPLWRLSLQEFTYACSTSNYRRIIEIDGNITGYLLSEISEDNCDIMRIAISDQYQNKGFGKTLINQLIFDCNKMGISNYAVNTNKKNVTALNFYLKSGFKIQPDRYPVYHRFIHVSPNNI